jgi:hypothetical protein
MVEESATLDEFERGACLGAPLRSDPVPRQKVVLSSTPLHIGIRGGSKTAATVRARSRLAPAPGGRGQEIAATRSAARPALELFICFIGSTNGQPKEMIHAS